MRVALAGRLSLFEAVSAKHEHVAALVAAFQGRGRDAHLLAYLDLFNRQRFHEAHDALEAWWLRERHGPDGEFLKGLIQLAGAFVHVQKNRRAPALALLRLAQQRLARFPPSHGGLHLAAALALGDAWRARLKSEATPAELLATAPPQLHWCE